MTNGPDFQYNVTKEYDHFQEISPAITMWSARALVTPAATVPTPISAPSFTLIRALGLAFFTIAGVHITEQAGYSDLIAVLMGTITGVAGGVFRDVLTAEIPMVLRRGQIYATAAIAGITVYLLLGSVLGLDERVADEHALFADLLASAF